MHPGGDVAAIMYSMDSTLTLTTTKGRTRWHWHGGGGGGGGVIEEEEEEESLSGPDLHGEGSRNASSNQGWLCAVWGVSPYRLRPLCRWGRIGARDVIAKNYKRRRREGRGCP